MSTEANNGFGSYVQSSILSTMERTSALRDAELVHARRSADALERLASIAGGIEAALWCACALGLMTLAAVGGAIVWRVTQ